MKKFYFSALLCFLSTILLGQQQILVSTITDPFNASGGVKIGPDGKIYIANFGQSLSQGTGPEVWRLVPGEAPELFATGLVGASGNDFDSQGNLFQSNIGASKISKITPDGTVSDFTSVGISNPVGIVIDEEDNLFVCNCGSDNIRKITPAGISTLFSQGPIFNCPNGITIDHEGNLYVSNFSDQYIIKITSDGTPSIFAEIPGGNNGHLTYFEKDSIFYVNSHAFSKIYRMDLAGNVTPIAGSGIRGNEDGPASSATFSRPNGIAVSVTGDTLFLNSSIPTVDNPATNFYPLNPSVIRMVTGLLVVGVEDALATTGKLEVFPNPTASNTTIYLNLPNSEEITLKLINNDGKLVKTLQESKLDQGAHQWNLSLSGLASGLYYLILSNGKSTLTKKLVINN